MENYEQKYKEALETARKINSGEGVAAPKDWSIPEVIFPELRKSENERIKTNIIKLLRFVRDTHHQYFDECNEAIDWFEKQREQKPTDKFKPKFKVGDWIISNDDSRLLRRIVTVDKIGYTTDCGYSSHYENYFHLWTIRDAKDGDILEFADHGRIVIGIVSHVNKVTRKVDVNCLLEGNNFKLGNYYALDTIKPHPATKEQCNLLFQKIKEAGYEWDTEKKKLIRYEQ